LKKTLLLVFLVLVALSARAGAAEWVFIATDEYGIEYYVDKSSVQQEGPYVRAWSKMLAPEEGTLEDRLYAFDVIHFGEYDCEGKKVRGLKTISYFRDGTSMELSAGPYFWKGVAPASIEAKEMKFVCGFY
jgi:hypothetical protein